LFPVVKSLLWFASLSVFILFYFSLTFSKMSDREEKNSRDTA